MLETPKETSRVWLVRAVTLAALGSGILNLYSVVGPSLPNRLLILRQMFPLEFIGLSRSVVLLTGFALILSSLNLFRRKRRAFQIVSGLVIASIVFHLTKGIDYEEASVSLLLLALLWAARRHFTVKSRTPDPRVSLTRLGIAFGVAFSYATAGFWLLEPGEFGLNFTIRQSLQQAFLALSFQSSNLVPQTRYAQWFLHSLWVITVTALVYSLFSLFRPVLYRFSSENGERAEATAIADRYGRSSLDYFKLWPDKSYFFSDSRQSFLAYRVAANFAVVLGDPVGPPCEMEEIVREFAQFCKNNDWAVAFYQALPDLAPVYESAGFKPLKVGDDAVVDLAGFSLEGSGAKAIRSGIRKLEKMGITSQLVEAPLPDSLLDEMNAVSEEWLRLPGRRERTVTLGLFERKYLKQTPVMTVRDASGRLLAFANLIRSYRSSEASGDLMRRRTDAPNGVMDYLFAQLFLECKQRGYERFSLGMAPMSGFQDWEKASPEERALHAFVQRLNFVFSYRGIKAYKAKFASAWEPRYLYYSNVLQLPKFALALDRVSSLRES
jgi:phosphatidylglycerol lysyltransferase